MIYPRRHTSLRKMFVRNRRPLFPDLLDFNAP
jgi:hypothetical protein